MHRAVEFRSSSAGHENDCAFLGKPLGRRQPDAAIRAGDDRNLAFEPTHGDLLYTALISYFGIGPGRFYFGPAEYFARLPDLLNRSLVKPGHD
jgi:hypothetical protein